MTDLPTLSQAKQLRAQLEGYEPEEPIVSKATARAISSHAPEPEVETASGEDLFGGGEAAPANRQKRTAKKPPAVARDDDAAHDDGRPSSKERFHIRIPLPEREIFDKAIHRIAMENRDLDLLSKAPNSMNDTYLAMIRIGYAEAQKNPKLLHDYLD